jgi:hypothetical protein
MNEVKQGIDSSRKLRNLNIKRQWDPNQNVKNILGLECYPVKKMVTDLFEASAKIILKYRTV